MKRRRFVRALTAAPAVPAILAQQTPSQNNAPSPTSPASPPLNPSQPPAPLNRTPPASMDYPKLEAAVSSDVGIAQPRFFSPPQFAALRKLSGLLMPPIGDFPGAIDAGVPEFLDFLIGQSPHDRQDVYRTGLDVLNSQAKKRFSKMFSDLEPAEATTLLSPLREPWTYDPPADPLARFLRVAKQDVRTATANSREYTAASSGRRGASGMGMYWLPLD